MLTKKRKIVLVLIGLLLVALVAVMLLCVSVAGEPWMAGGCVSISWDKAVMRQADKMLFHVDGVTYTITDPALVQSVAEETLAGTYTDYCCAHLDSGWMEIYRGDRLLRRMRYVGGSHDTFAYEADWGHWVLFGDESHATLSRETADALYAIIGKS